MSEAINHTTEITFDDGYALSENVRLEGTLVGSIWTEGEGLGYKARAISNVAGYWAKDELHFGTREAALYSILHQAKFERRLIGTICVTSAPTAPNRSTR